MSTAKQSGRRPLPPGWRWVKLRGFMPKSLSSVNPSQFPNEQFLLFSIPAYDKGAPITTLGKDIGSNKQTLHKGDVLLSKIVPHIRRTWVVDKEHSLRMIGSTEWIVFRTDGVDPFYLQYALREDRFHSFFMDTKSGVGGSLTRARPALVANIEIPLPPLAEQQRIAAILREQMSAADQARCAAEARLEAINAIPAAYMQDSLKSRRTRTLPLGKCLVETRQGVGPGWSNYPVLGATRGGLAPAKEGVGKHPERYKLVDPVSVFYNPMRILLGSIALVDENDQAGITSPDYVAVKGRDGVLDTRWFYYWFRSSHGIKLIESLSRGAVRERILFNRLAEGEIVIPDFDAQCSASLKMQQIKPIADQIAQELETINALPPALLRKAFTGEL